jgi:alkanesulfonate monooxygenase SsuD/methylene tetrahydromethanopterin reductase-like flavin-dependent oxidoreductase (luciferase family)
MCNLFGPPDEVRHKLEVLAGHCEAVGRDPKTINKTRLGTMFIGKTREAAEAKLGEQLAARGMNLSTMDDATRQAVAGMFHVGGPDEIASQVHELLEAGLDGLIFNLIDAHDLDAVALAGSVLQPLLAT